MKKKSRQSSLWLGSGLLLCTILSGPVAGAKSQSLGTVTMTEVAPRIVTPNGDLKNDVVFFRFDTSLTGVPLETNVFDVNGAKVSSLEMASTGDVLTWNGKDDSGNSVPSGIYIYSIKIGKNLATGTVVVAR